MLLPLLLVISKVSLERLLAPRGVDRVRDWRKGTDTLVHAWVLQEQSQGTMATHAVSRNANARRVQLGEGRVQRFW